MAPLTWRNVEGPDLSAVSDMTARAGESFQNAFTGLAGVAGNVQKKKTEDFSAEAIARANGITDPEAFQAALADGSLLGGRKPGELTAEAQAYFNNRPMQLLDYQAKELSIAASKQAMAIAGRKASGGGGNGNGGNGGNGSGNNNGFGGPGSNNKSPTSYNSGQAELMLQKGAEAEARGDLREAQLFYTMARDFGGNNGVVDAVTRAGGEIAQAAGIEYGEKLRTEITPEVDIIFSKGIPREAGLLQLTNKYSGAGNEKQLEIATQEYNRMWDSADIDPDTGLARPRIVDPSKFTAPGSTPVSAAAPAAARPPGLSFPVGGTSASMGNTAQFLSFGSALQPQAAAPATDRSGAPAQSAGDFNWRAEGSPAAAAMPSQPPSAATMYGTNFLGTLPGSPAPAAQTAQAATGNAQPTNGTIPIFTTPPSTVTFDNLVLDQETAISAAMRSNPDIIIDDAKKSFSEVYKADMPNTDGSSSGIIGGKDAVMAKLATGLGIELDNGMAPVGFVKEITEFAKANGLEGDIPTVAAIISQTKRDWYNPGYGLGWGLGSFRNYYDLDQASVLGKQYGEKGGAERIALKNAELRRIPADFTELQNKYQKAVTLTDTLERNGRVGTPQHTAAYEDMMRLANEVGAYDARSKIGDADRRPGGKPKPVSGESKPVSDILSALVNSWDKPTTQYRGRDFAFKEQAKTKKLLAVQETIASLPSVVKGIKGKGFAENVKTFFNSRAIKDGEFTPIELKRMREQFAKIAKDNAGRTSTIEWAKKNPRRDPEYSDDEEGQDN